MKIFITGATGFVGTPTVRQMVAAGHAVLALQRKGSRSLEGVTSLIGDLSDIERLQGAISDFGPDAAIHLAWQGIPDYSADNSMRNVDYSMRLYHTLLTAGCKCIVSTGSCWEYARPSGAIAEDHPLDGGKPFPTAKNMLRLAGAEMAEEASARFYWLRLYYVYGPGQKAASLIPTIALARLAGEKPTIKNLNAACDFVYVDDVASAIVAVTEKQPEGSVLNVGSGKLTSNAEVLSIIDNELGISSETFAQSTASTGFWADLTSAKNGSLWKPAYDMKTGVGNALNYFKALTKEHA